MYRGAIDSISYNEMYSVFEMFNLFLKACGCIRLVLSHSSPFGTLSHVPAVQEEITFLWLFILLILALNSYAERFQ